MLEGNHEFRHKAFIANMAAIPRDTPVCRWRKGLA